MGRIRAIFAQAIFAALLLLAPACASQTLYEWGRYEDSLAELFRSGEAGNRAAEHIAQLSDLVERSRSAGKRVPPGVLAHIGYLHAVEGNLGEARRYFLAEKSEWPESQVFMARLIERTGR